MLPDGAHTIDIVLPERVVHWSFSSGEGMPNTITFRSTDDDWSIRLR
jgi:hypothetical protein